MNLLATLRERQQKINLESHKARKAMCSSSETEVKGSDQEVRAISGANLRKLDQVKNTLLFPGVAFHLFKLSQPREVVPVNSGSGAKDPDDYVMRTKIKSFFLVNRGSGFRMELRSISVVS